MDKGFIFRRLIILGCIEGLLYWGVDYKIDYIFWITSICFLTVTIISILFNEKMDVKE